MIEFSDGSALRDEKIGERENSAVQGAAFFSRKHAPQSNEKYLPRGDTMQFSERNLASTSWSGRFWRGHTAAVFIISSAMTPLVHAQTAGDPLVAKIGNAEIHESDLKIAAEDVGQNNPGKDEAAKHEYLVNYVSDMILLANAAEANRLMDDAEVKRRILFSRNKTLMERMLAHTAVNAVNEDSVRKAYDEATRQISNEMEVHARHILFKVADLKDATLNATAEERARAAVQRVRNGEEYLAVAKDLSGDPAGNQIENDLGFFAKSRMMSEIAEAAFKLEPGQVSDPVKTAFGWHVVFVVEKRIPQAPEFDKVRPQLETYVMRKAQFDLINKLRAAAPVERVPGPSQAGEKQ